MPKYIVNVAITSHKDISIYANDESEAEEKAEEIVSKWQGVEDVEVLDVTPED